MANFKVSKYRIIAAAALFLVVIIVCAVGLGRFRGNAGAAKAGAAEIAADGSIANSGAARNIATDSSTSNSSTARNNVAENNTADNSAARNIATDSNTSNSSAAINIATDSSISNSSTARNSAAASGCPAASKNFSANTAAGNLPPKKYKLKVEESYRHDLSAYTQGLFIHDGMMYESTGQHGESSFRKVDVASGKVLQRIQLPSRYFGEGSCVFEGRAYLLTWHSQVCFVYDIGSFAKLAELRYTGEGWGLATDGTDLIMSDGSSKICFRDPLTFLEKRSVTVKLEGREVDYINELEYIDGKIWANVYGQDQIVIINPKNGKVEGTVDCGGLLESRYKSKNTDVLNGIAYNPENGAIYLTGKYWPRLYKISLMEK